MSIADYGFAIWETFYVTALSTAFALVLGLPLGVLLVAGDKDGILPLPGWLDVYKRQVDVLEPAVFQDERLIKLEEEILPEAERSAAVEQLFEQFVLCSHSHPHFPVLLEFCNLIFPKKGRCPSWGCLPVVPLSAS